MLGGLVPATARLQATRGDRGADPRFPAERSQVAQAVARRQVEYHTVRWCARQAMARLGLPPRAVLRGPDGAPVWPSGVVGSLTHCDGFRAAVVALARDLKSLGIDAEPDQPLPEGLVSAVAGAGERRMLEALPRSGAPAWDRLLFSAKEAAYKAWYPAGQRLLGFDDAVVRIDEDGTWQATLPDPAGAGSALSLVHGRWRRHEGILVTAASLSATQIPHVSNPTG